jgi:tetratricopeptide (TPR) repeat protein
MVQKAADRAQSVVWLEPEEQDRLLRRRSLLEAKQGHYAAAIVGLSLLIERHPQAAADYNNRGLVYFQSGQIELALADYNHAIALNPKLASAYNNRANYFAAQGQLAEAIADYETAISLDPTHLRAWINQGITFQELEMYAQALENFDHALYITQLLIHNREELTWLKAHLYGSRGRTHHLCGDWNCAIADYHQAQQLMETLEPTVASRRLADRLQTWLKALQVGEQQQS